MMQREPVWVLGAMSGTSMDGVDAALILTDGTDVIDFGPTRYRPYTATERDTIRAALGLWPGDPAVAEASEVVETAHAEALSPLARDADLIGFHGQTLAHDPGGRGTHQAGDGAVLAEVLGRPVVWDFRSTDVRLGGQGAPLAPFYHFALARRLNLGGPTAFLNLGGVGNLTWADPSAATPDTPNACMAFDTGPANAPLDDLMRARRGVDYDGGGVLSQSGTPDDTILARFLAHPWFHKMPPKSLDRNDFAWLGDAVNDLPDADAAATLAACAADAVVRGAEHFPAPPGALLVTGGGRRNAAMMERLAAGLQCPVLPVEEAGLDGDMIEAQAFAHLAARVLYGLPTSCPGTTGVPAAVGGGQVSRPQGRRGFSG
jgi:anhydro-N-acetylmuramic acid kinase